MTKNMFAALSVLAITACSHAYLPDAYTYPTGYTHHDITPISSPHGYNKTLADETAFKGTIADNREAWRNGLATILMPLAPALDMNTPVAVVMDPGLTPLNASAANYLRDMLVAMSYLTALPSETDQHVILSAWPVRSQTDMYDVTLSVRRGDAVIATHHGTINVPHQMAETPRLPGFSRHPVTGPSANPPGTRFN